MAERPEVEPTTTADTAVVSTTPGNTPGRRSPVAGDDSLAQPMPRGDRFEIAQRLGSGGFGSVYEALDRKHDSRVALKLLARREPEWLYSFKREFRQLANIVHPRLVTLYELVSSDEQWFFTMELIRGEQLMDHIRPGESGYVERGRDAVRQLAEGVHHLHGLRRLHRDVKPSNILVRPNGDVVLLDFGLVVSIDGQEGRTDRFAGTPAYMSPEQASVEPLTEASDWYSVGVILYRALTGELPVRCNIRDAARNKRTHAVKPPSTVSNDCVPPELDALCMALLAPDAAQRPTGDEIVSSLTRAPRRSASRARPRETAPFVGRTQELERLRDALAKSRVGQPVVAEVRGLSGMGKSSLVQQFLHRVREDDPMAVVLEGRCYQQESTPYRGVDAAIDALCQFWVSAEPQEAASYISRHVADLCTLFPVLRRVRIVAQTAARGDPFRQNDDRDDRDVRRGAIASLRELLRTISQRRQLVLFLDDMQWSDADSVNLVTRLLLPPDPPALLLIACYRSDEIRDSPALCALQAELGSSLRAVQRITVDVGRLGNHEALTLVESVAAEHGERGGRWDAMVRESDGSPMFLTELARGGDRARATETITLDGILVARAHSLDEPTQRLLEIVAVAGRPLQVDIALAAARRSLPIESAHAALAKLRALHLTRGRELEDGERVEPYHDRVREALVGSLSAEDRARRHGDLAAVLAYDPDRHVDALVHHLLGAGQRRLGVRYARRAAAAAERALAFERAAQLYRLALEGASDDRALRMLTRSLAAALSAAGRGAEAAAAYLEAASLADGDDAHEMRRLAATHMVCCGDVARGIEVTKQVLRGVGERLPRTLPGAIASYLVSHALLSLRARRPIEPSEPPDPTHARQIDALFSAGRALCIVTPVKSAALIARSAHLALKQGDARRIALSLTFHAAALDVLMPGRGRRILERAVEFAARVGISDDHYVGGFMDILQGMVLFFRGDTIRGGALCDRGEQRLASTCRGVEYELMIAQVHSALALGNSARIADLLQRVPAAARDAESRGDRYSALSVRLAAGYVGYLAEDRTEELEQLCLQAETDWDLEAFFSLGLFTTFCRAALHAYRGDLVAATDFLEARIRGFARGDGGRIPLSRVSMRVLHARYITNAVRQVPKSRRHEWTRRARRSIRALERSYKPGGYGLLDSALLSRYVRGQLAASLGHYDEALPLLARAEVEMCSVGLGIISLGVRHLRGEIIGGDEGDELRRSVIDYLVGQGVKRPLVFLLRGYSE